jgi:methyltransferase (TIGR00027 family)
MEAGQASRTALGAAMHRAAHRTLEAGAVFTDPYALKIIGSQARERLDEWAGAPQRRPMRLFIAARHRVADEKLADAASRGVRLAVIVGAGLDTSALRGVPTAPDMAFYEIDHPATQAWKRQRLKEEGIEPPVGLKFAPVNFETGTLKDGLAAAGFDAGKPAMFVWLGVVPYLTENAIFETLVFIATVPQAEVVFNYANPATQMSAAYAQRHHERAAHVSAIGEPWISYFDSADLARRLRGLGVVEIQDLGPADIQPDIFGVAQPTYAGAGGHILWARWA